MKKESENKLTFKKVQILDLNQMLKVTGGVGGDDDDHRTRTTIKMSTRDCDQGQNNGG